MRKRHADLAWLLFDKAEADRLAASRLTSLGGPYSIVCFHYQQAAEKYLKASLGAHRVVFPRTHDLTALAGLGLAVLPELHRIASRLATLQPYAVQVRYDDVFNPGAEEAREAGQIVEDVRDVVMRTMPPRP